MLHKDIPSHSDLLREYSKPFQCVVVVGGGGGSGEEAATCGVRKTETRRKSWE